METKLRPLMASVCVLAVLSSVIIYSGVLVFQKFHPVPHDAHTPPSVIDAGTIAAVGINYGRVADNLPEPDEVVQLLVKLGIRKVKIYDASSTVIKAFGNSNLQLIIGLPNEEIATMAMNTSAAYGWVKTKIADYPRTQITAIAVGNEVLTYAQDISRYLMSAMRNIHAALVELKLDEAVRVSTPHSLSVLSNSYPPSAGLFNEKFENSIMRPLLDFLYTTESYVMINIYPYIAYNGNPDEIALGYALFQPTAPVEDPNSTRQYFNLFDAQVDSFFSAMTRMDARFRDIKIVVTETGWPTTGDQNELGSNMRNAASYNSNLVKHIKSGVGTPLQPKAELETYLFALFNEDQKGGPTSERNYGFFYPDKSEVYFFNFSSGNSDQSKDEGTEGADPSYCLAKSGVSPEQLQAALDYACGPGGANCEPLQEGQSCFEPNTLWAHASYAFNSYYQKNQRKEGTCNFGGNSIVNVSDPSTSACTFPTQ